MNDINITIAGGNYDRTKLLIDGSVKPQGINLNYISLEPDEIFWRMIRYKEFDASEMSMAAYVILLSRGFDEFQAIPVFPSRMFRHSSIYIKKQSKIKSVKDLNNARIGLPEFQMTMAVWVRGILKNEYGIDLENVEWFLGGVDKPGREERIEVKTRKYDITRVQDVTLTEMLLRDELDAIISAKMPKKFVEGNGIERLFKDYQNEEEKFYKKEGIIPIMHVVIIKKEVLNKNPWIATSLYKAYNEAMKNALDYIYNTDALPISMIWLPAYIENEKSFFNEELINVWGNGIKNNYKILNTFLKYCDQQDLLDKKLNVEDLFVKSFL